LRTLAVLILSASAALAQQSPILSGAQHASLLQRSVHLMESAAVTIPELARAGAPVTENARQAMEMVARTGQQPITQTYKFVANLNAYLVLADSVPKPFPFPEEARKQLAELNDARDRLKAHLEAAIEQAEVRLRGSDRDNLRRYADANAQLAPPQARKNRVVFLGDSITDGWRLHEYFPDHDFVNRGISGQITGEMLGRMKADVIDRKPAVMVVLAGTNDIARGVPVTTIQNNLTMIADLAVAHGIKPVFASILPIHDYNKEKNPRWEMSTSRPMGTIRQLNTFIENMCRQRNFVYLDYFSAMIDQQGFLKAELAEDGLHPNATGYRVMAPLALAAIQKGLAAEAAVPATRNRRSKAAAPAAK
jgi:lysophospholipase L1-like esterase